MADPGQFCPCGSGKSLPTCCGRFLQNQQQAKTPEQLMRSRYCAYALGGFGQYLLDTWFPATAAGLDVVSLSQRSSDWCGLDIISRSQRGDEGTVEFKAWFEDGDGSRQAMHEVSEFRRIGGRWLYVGGQVSTSTE